MICGSWYNMAEVILVSGGRVVCGGYGVILHFYGKW